MMAFETTLAERQTTVPVGRAIIDRRLTSLEKEIVRKAVSARNFNSDRLLAFFATHVTGHCDGVTSGELVPFRDGEDWNIGEVSSFRADFMGRIQAKVVWNTLESKKKKGKMKLKKNARFVDLAAIRSYRDALARFEEQRSDFFLGQADQEYAAEQIARYGNMHKTAARVGKIDMSKALNERGKPIIAPQIDSVDSVQAKPENRLVAVQPKNPRRKSGSGVFGKTVRNPLFYIPASLAVLAACSASVMRSDAITSNLFGERPSLAFTVRDRAPDVQNSGMYLNADEITTSNEVVTDRNGKTRYLSWDEYFANNALSPRSSNLGEVTVTPGDVRMATGIAAVGGVEGSESTEPENFTEADRTN